ncbi:hypothetical protein NKR19_g10304 [Coniochaeta hoffmannii]|uniref:DUF7726 domain-containing protein n=1 Tax=Coniochaeta hoffmannii TaxID=91930 RepID=A0AA38RDY4_9PEZI|nr:hypothetical protein NKR19_g10304 [Coniochaeta hoffmannii]
MSRYSPQAGHAVRQGLMEIDPNRVMVQQPLGTGKSTVPTVSAVPCPLPKFAPGPLPAPFSAHQPAARLPPHQATLVDPKAVSFKKRKSDVLENGTNSAATRSTEAGNQGGSLLDVTDNCDVVRSKIRALVGSGEMKVGEFQRAIGVSPNAYSAFMKQDGPAAGQRSATYTKAIIFFAKRDLSSLSNSDLVNFGSNNTTKRAKKEESAKAVDLSSITLPGEEYGRVPVFDTCNEIRRKIRAFLKKDGLSQAAFCRELTKIVAASGRRINASSLANFMGQKGPSGGSGSIVFYAAYIYFEKMRVRDGKPKSQTRQEMESVWGEDGMDLPEEGRGGQRRYWCLGNERPYEDKYGKIHFSSR